MGEMGSQCNEWRMGVMCNAFLYSMVQSKSKTKSFYESVVILNYLYSVPT